MDFINNRVYIQVLLTFIAFTFISSKCLGQKKVMLMTRATDGSKHYNLDGADLYFVSEHDTLFIPKLDKHEFSIPSDYDSIVTNSSEAFFILLETDKMLFVAHLNIRRYKTSSELRMGFTKSKHRSYQIIGYCQKECLFEMSIMADMIVKKTVRFY